MDRGEAIEVVPGIRKNSHVFRGPDGHTYHYNREMKGGRISLECVLRKSQGVWCRGRASVGSNGQDFKATQGHSHEDDQLRFQIQQFRNAVLSRCRKGDFAPLRLIYNDERRKLRNRRVCASLPFVSLRPAMDRARKINLPCIPHTLPALADVLENAEYVHLAETLDSEDNIYAGRGGSRDDGTAFIILASRRMLGEMSVSRKVFSDATFCTPSGLECRQIWNIVTLHGHHIIPLARVLMQTKTQQTYELVLEKFKAVIPAFNPVEVMCDFEQGQENAWKTTYPNVTVHGCLFHSAKAISGKAKKLKLVPFIKQNHSANSIVRSMCALALLPSSEIPKALVKLARRANREEVWPRLCPLFVHFQRYWLPRTDILSVYGCPDRTNNACESDNRSLRAAITFKHPNIFCFLKGVLEMEDDAFQDLEVLKIGKRASRKRRASVLANDQKIRDLLADLREKRIHCTDFLRRVSRRIQRPFNRGLGVDDNFG